jgi:hypothetical protein
MKVGTGIIAFGEGRRRRELLERSASFQLALDQLADASGLPFLALNRGIDAALDAISKGRA